VKKLVVIPFFVAINFTELKIILFLKYGLSQKYGFGIQDPEKTYSRSRIPGSKRHRIPDLQHCPILKQAYGFKI
jgi:hypothetical protein